MMRIAVIFAFCFLANFAGAERSRRSFDADWRFGLGDQEGAESLAFDDSSWRTVDVPHDWSIEGDYAAGNPMGDMAGYLPAGIGWYRKTVAVPPAWKGKRVEIAFDGVFMNSTVWANGVKLGTRPYGWSSFSYDISAIAANADRITFAVRVDNEAQPSARWYTGSGIYAHTWIDVKETAHVVRDGLYIRTDANRVSIDAEVRNAAEHPQAVNFVLTILSPDGKEVAKEGRRLSLAPGSQATNSFAFKLADPLRWDIDCPNLYTAVATLEFEDGRRETTRTRFGIRDIEWKPETGMWLNGRNVKLRGVCNHQDAGALGAAVPDKILRFRIEQLKAMGCNAIRTAHNPQTPIFYDICDEVGMLVMDEIFDGWERKAPEDYGARFFEQWWRRDVTDWIRRDRNHPSVVIYSVGNETHGEVASELVALCHELDNTRPVTSGHSGSEHMDVFGVNGASEQVGWFENLDKERVFIGTENTHTWQVRGFYRTMTWYRNGYPSAKHLPYETPDLTASEIFTYDWTTDAKRGNFKQRFNSSYDNAMVRLNARRNIEQLRDIPNYAGSFRWTGHDYIGEAGFVHGGWPFRAFMGGAIDLANFEKDLYYLYQSQWTVDPMVRILPQWTHPTMAEGTEIPVWVYSNCDAVELFLDGVSLGRETPGAQWDKMQCQWMVPWKPGALKAVGYIDGKAVAEQLIRAAGAPARIALSIDGEPLSGQGKDIAQVRVTTQDAAGAFYPYGENRTGFQVIGPGRIRALDNGDPVDVERHFEADSRNAFFGLTRAYVESTGDEGDIALLASCILGEKRLLTSKLISIDAQLLALRGKAPRGGIKIFYTTDGSEPTRKSTRYQRSFPVSLGTTVRALVELNGRPAQWLEERFGSNEGIVWNSPQASGPIGEQAENATFAEATVSVAGIGYNGKGFVQFGKGTGGFLEWYQENDGDAGSAGLLIRYSGSAKNREGYEVDVSVSGKTVRSGLLLRNTAASGEGWRTVEIDIPLGRGANTIRLEPKAGHGLCIDEIFVR